MEITSLVVAYCLLGQIPDASTVVPVPSQQPGDGNSDASKGDSDALKEGPAQRLVRELALTADSGIAGRPMPLVDVLSPVFDRRQQIDATLAYWKLWSATAELQNVSDELRRYQELDLADTSGAAADSGSLQVAARLASAQARRREAEIGLAEAQYELVALAGRLATEPLPLPTDLPHVGAYRTSFAEIYTGGRAAPPRAHLIDRALPLRRQSLEGRAVAVQAAIDAAEAATEAYQQGQLELGVALASVSEVGRQRQAFISSATQYNLDIAEYALSIAPPGMNTADLVALLIRTRTVQPAGAVERAGFNAPLPAQPEGKRVGEPTLAPPRSSQDEAGATEGDQSNPGDRTDDDPRGDPPADATEEGSDEATQADKAIGIWTKRETARRQSLDTVDRPLGLYPALVDLPAGRRAWQLSRSLHWDRTLSGSAMPPVTLEECLSWVLPAARPTVIAAYWQARQRAAAHQAVSQGIEQLAALEPTALEARHDDGGAEAMLRLRLAQVTAAADLVDAHLELLTSQFELLTAATRPLEGDWPLPATAPHSGSYRLKLEAQPQWLAQSADIRRLADVIPAMYTLVTDRAASVVASDSARAAATAEYEVRLRADGGVDEPIAAIHSQAEETLGFLAAEAEYNQQIARYALAVLPLDTPDSTLAGALVVSRPAASERGADDVP